MTDALTIHIEDHIAHLQLNRPDAHNAIDGPIMNGLIAFAQQMMKPGEVRVVVISGAGKSFCAGLDMSNFAALADGGADKGQAASTPLLERTHGISNLFQNAARVWRELPVPVIAALHGVALGGGFQLALGADIRYAAPGTRMAVLEIKWGLVPDMAGTQLMRHLARDDVIRELTYTGRMFEAEEAQQLGFVTRVCEDPYQAAMDTARYIATRNPDAIRADKQLLNESLYLDEVEGLMLESRLQDAIMGKPNQVEAVMAELEGRAARFS